MPKYGTIHPWSGSFPVISQVAGDVEAALLMAGGAKLGGPSFRQANWSSSEVARFPVTDTKPVIRMFSQPLRPEGKQVRIHTSGPPTRRPAHRPRVPVQPLPFGPSRSCFHFFIGDLVRCPGLASRLHRGTRLSQREHQITTCSSRRGRYRTSFHGWALPNSAPQYPLRSA